MITGFNTDIEFDGKTYHVQTEDKGLATPIVLSLVYDRGTILASKRTPYDDLLEGTLDEEVLAERLQKQHRLICAAIRSGRIEDLKEMTAREANGTSKKKRAASLAKAADFRSVTTIVDPESVELEAPIPKPFYEYVFNANADLSGIETFIEDVEVIDDESEIILPDEAVEIVSEMVGKERPVNSRLTIEFLGDAKFRGGDRKTVMFMVCRGSERKVVGDAQVMVKILGSSFRPVIFHSKTDNNGIAKVNLQLPNFSGGRAAFLVRATSGGEEVELRRAVAQG